jgi:tight adherence protein C
MRWLAVGLACTSPILLARAVRACSLGDRVAVYLAPQREEEYRTSRRLPDRVARSLPWVVAGALVGALVGQGDFFLEGQGRPTMALTMLGAAGGWFVYSANGTTRRQRRVDRLRNELPVVIDALSLQVVSGESVMSAMRNVVRTTEGVASEEMQWILEEADAVGVERALMTGARSSTHDDGRRLYETLAHAHTVGGRLVESLSELSTDVRAGLERDLTTEGGRRALATYGPVLALMVPTALLFLLYPTVLGLRMLSGAP